MKVQLAIVRSAIEQMLQHVESLRGDTIEIEPSLYWFIPKPQVYDPVTDPTGFTLGSLEDDWAEVAAIGRLEKEPIEYTLVWAASVLRALGE